MRVRRGPYSRNGGAYSRGAGDSAPPPQLSPPLMKPSSDIFLLLRGSDLHVAEMLLKPGSCYSPICLGTRVETSLQLPGSLACRRLRSPLNMRILLALIPCCPSRSTLCRDRRSQRASFTVDRPTMSVLAHDPSAPPFPQSSIVTWVGNGGPKKDESPQSRRTSSNGQQCN
ncbi:hypothetical protein B0H11DRAFT_2075989 [Mycena galericulata]|nr:hypothetical protein B0H11DRAFT_2075989 [Mycena galericulata]